MLHPRIFIKYAPHKGETGDTSGDYGNDLDDGLAKALFFSACYSFNCPNLTARYNDILGVYKILKDVQDANTYDDRYQDCAKAIIYRHKTPFSDTFLENKFSFDCDYDNTFCTPGIDITNGGDRDYFLFIDLTTNKYIIYLGAEAPSGVGNPLCSYEQYGTYKHGTETEIDKYVREQSWHDRESILNVVASLPDSISAKIFLKEQPNINSNSQNDIEEIGDFDRKDYVQRDHIELPFFVQQELKKGTVMTNEEAFAFMDEEVRDAAMINHGLVQPLTYDQDKKLYNDQLQACNNLHQVLGTLLSKDLSLKFISKVSFYRSLANGDTEVIVTNSFGQIATLKIDHERLTVLNANDEVIKTFPFSSLSFVFYKFKVGDIPMTGEISVNRYIDKTCLSIDDKKLFAIKDTKTRFLKLLDTGFGNSLELKIAKQQLIDAKYDMRFYDSENNYNFYLYKDELRYSKYKHFSINEQTENISLNLTLNNFATGITYFMDGMNRLERVLSVELAPQLCKRGTLKEAFAYKKIDYNNAAELQEETLNPEKMSESKLKNDVNIDE